MHLLPKFVITILNLGPSVQNQGPNQDQPIALSLYSPLAIALLEISAPRKSGYTIKINQ